MKGKRSRSRGIRYSVRNLTLCGLLAVAGTTLVVLGIRNMQATGTSGSPLLALGLMLALPSSIAFIYQLSIVPTFRDLHAGRNVIARWKVPAREFQRFCAAERDMPARSVMVNFYRPPRSIPVDGIEVIFSNTGVLIEGGYSPLSTIGGRRVQAVRMITTEPASIEFTMVLETRVRTSSASSAAHREVVMLRVPVASNAMQEADDVVRHYRSMIGGG